MQRISPRSFRSKKALTALTAAAGLAATVQLSHAQTWINTAGGSWSVPGNWFNNTVPTSSNSTVVLFNATAAQSYTAFQNIATPFNLNAINFNNGGTGLITIAGQDLSFGGTNAAINIAGSGGQTVSNNIQIQSGADQTPLTIGGSGAGALTLTGALSSNPASGGTAGGFINMNNANSSLNLSGGGTLYALASNSGSINVTGGTWTLTSNERGNDPVTTTNDGGFWGMAIGNTSGQTTRFSQTGGTINASGAGAFIANVAGSTSIATFSGAGTAFNISGGRFGVNFGVGSIAVQNGAAVTCNLLEGARQVGSTANISVGSNSVINVNQTTIGRSANSTGTVSITGGGSVNAGGGGSASFMASVANSGGTLIVSGAGSRYVNQQVFIAAGGSLVDAGTANISVNSGGLLQAQRFTFGQDAGGQTLVNLDGPGSKIDVAGIGSGTGSWASGVGNNLSTATMNITNGANANLPAGALFLAGGIVNGTGDPVQSGTAVFNITGAGANTSTASLGFLQAGQNPDGHGFMNVNTLATVNVGTNIIIGLDPAATGALKVSGASAVLNGPGFVAPIPANTSTGDPIPAALEASP